MLGHLEFCEHADDNHKDDYLEPSGYGSKNAGKRRAKVRQQIQDVSIMEKAADGSDEERPLNSDESDDD
jgi:hypothetical protein